MLLYIVVAIIVTVVGGWYVKNSTGPYNRFELDNTIAAAFVLVASSGVAAFLLMLVGLGFETEAVQGDVQVLEPVNGLYLTPTTMNDKLAYVYYYKENGVVKMDYEYARHVHLSYDNNARLVQTKKYSPIFLPRWMGAEDSEYTFYVPKAGVGAITPKQLTTMAN